MDRFLRKLVELEKQVKGPELKKVAREERERYEKLLRGPQKPQKPN